MDMMQFPLSINIAIFVAAAVTVWFAGSRLARYADAIAEQTGMARELLGMVLLGGITSLPELTIAVTSTLREVPVLSVNDVLGSAAINVVILAIADATTGRSALTSKLPSSSVLLQGVLGMMLMALAVGAVIAGDRLVFGMGIWSWMMLLGYFGSISLLAKSRATQAWRPSRTPEAIESSDRTSTTHRRPLAAQIRGTIATGAAILVAGFLLASSAEALSEQTGLGTSFFGAVFLGFSTSLPEVSTVLGAVRLRRYEMAISDVFGTNMFNIMAIVLVDALHPGGPILVEAGRFASFAALLAMLLTALFVVGMLERRDRAFLRMGLDSIAVILVYLAGVLVLYNLR